MVKSSALSASEDSDQIFEVVLKLDNKKKRNLEF